MSDDPNRRLLFAGEWTDDCQGKKDYDGPILVISTRYWPAGGGFTLVERSPAGVRFEENADRPNIKPSAHSSLLIRSNGDDDYCLVEIDVKADTEADVKAKVEAFVQEQMDKAVQALKAAFYVDPNGSPR